MKCVCGQDGVYVRRCDGVEEYSCHESFGCYNKKEQIPDPNIEEFQDKRGRTWEMFIDIGYYHMTCVRLKTDRTWNSQTSFHFSTYKKAQTFADLLKEST